LKDKRHGQLLVQFDGGTEADFQAAKEYIENQGIIVEVLGHKGKSFATFAKTGSVASSPINCS
jgi:hypothetical protein